MLKTVMKSSGRILVCVAVVALLTGMGCINSLMFHPDFCRGGYGESTEGYVDIGTNGVKIAAIVLGPERGKKAILRCHGNAEDAANSLFALRYLARRGFTVACVDYPGYGLSDGSPDEDGCYRNVHCLYDWLIEKRGFKPEDIIVDGFSIGSGPATELAATKPVGRLVLEAPFLSAPRVVTRIRILPIDPFPNLKVINAQRRRGVQSGSPGRVHILRDAAKGDDFAVELEGDGHLSQLRSRRHRPRREGNTLHGFRAAPAAVLRRALRQDDRGRV